MDISTVNNTGGLYFASLTSPFIGKKPVTIHAYNAFNPAKPAEGTFSRKHFETKTPVQSKLNINTSAGSIKSSKSIVENSISGGFSPLEAVQMYKAQKAYGLSNLGVTSGVHRMTVGYTV